MKKKRSKKFDYKFLVVTIVMVIITTMLGACTVYLLNFNNKYDTFKCYVDDNNYDIFDFDEDGKLMSITNFYRRDYLKNYPFKSYEDGVIKLNGSTVNVSNKFWYNDQEIYKYSIYNYAVDNDDIEVLFSQYYGLDKNEIINDLYYKILFDKKHSMYSYCE